MQIVTILKRHFPNVTSIRDAKGAVVVHVTPKDNKKGTRGNFGECALAKACKRELHADGVYIGLSTSYVVIGNKAVRYATPVAVSREITSFDRHGDFNPGTYRLVPFGPSMKIGNQPRKKMRSQMTHVRVRKHKVHKTARVRTVAA